MRNMDSLAGECQEVLSPYAELVGDIRRESAKRICVLVKMPACPEDKVALYAGSDHPEIFSQWLDVQRQVVAAQRELAALAGPERIRLLYPHASRSPETRRIVFGRCFSSPCALSARMASIEGAEYSEEDMRGLLEMLQQKWERGTEKESDDASALYNLMFADVRYPASFLMERGEEGLSHIEGLAPPDAQEDFERAQAEAERQGLEGDDLNKALDVFRTRFRNECLRYAADRTERTVQEGEIGVIAINRLDSRFGFMREKERKVFAGGNTFERAFAENREGADLRVLVFNPFSLSPLVRNAFRVVEESRSDRPPEASESE